MCPLSVRAIFKRVLQLQPLISQHTHKKTQIRIHTNVNIFLTTVSCLVDDGAVFFHTNMNSRSISARTLHQTTSLNSLEISARGLPNATTTAYFVPQMTRCAATGLYILVFQLSPNFYTGSALFWSVLFLAVFMTTCIPTTIPYL